MKETITYDDFAKLDIRVGTIKTVEAVPKSKKLLKLSVSFGPEIGDRTIMAGIAQGTPQYGYVSQETGEWIDSCLINQRVLAVINLAPRAMMGVESHGMLLAAHDVKDQTWLTTVGPVPNGSEVG